MTTKELPSVYQQFIHKSRYARWLPEENRREEWHETVARYFNFFEKHLEKNCGYILDKKTRKYLEDKVLNLEVMPSMRALMTAGPALEKENIAGYNCSYIPVDHPKAFDEILYVLMCGTGVGFSVEKKYIENLPIVADNMHPTETTIVVRDSKLGWAKAFREILTLLYAGQIPKWDISNIRGAGERLHTFGGRASGPGPLVDLFNFATEVFTKAQGRRLTSLECHDLVCKVGEIVVVGGVRRSAMISLSDLNDREMRDAKSGEWYRVESQRALSNNSAVYQNKPENIGVFMEEWLSLYKSGSGERGIFNRQASKTVASRNKRRDTDFEFGTNPCSEIILRPHQVCNLSECVVRSGDSEEKLLDKVTAATILGTMQATLTSFKYLRKTWKETTEKERLLGVSLTGIMDHKILSGNIFNKAALKDLLVKLKNKSIAVNKEWAKKFKINQSTAITCVKPSGTVSQLVNAASGIHARHNDYYIRRVRGDKKDPLTQFLISQNIPTESCVMKPDSTSVFSFVEKAPDYGLTRHSRTAIEQLEHWLIYAEHWCEHKPSITISVNDDEWLGVADWCWRHFDELTGVSFLPNFGHVYQQAPYEDIDKATYDKLQKKQPNEINWNELMTYEKEDTTKSSQTLACTAGACEIVDV
ncbi:MAG: ribonucleoside-triphosphate reductase [Flavobacteriaceae bacterium]|nr:ribonucleoside-triphosphate reductase [Flavobacteriaceae bacterium]